MDKYVIAGKLSVNTCYYLPVEALDALAGISSDIVLFHVNNFIKNAQKSTDLIERGVAQKLERSYAIINDRNRYLDSETTKVLAEELRNLQFEDISANVPEDKLKGWIVLIDEILDNEDAVPYIAKITSSSIEDALDKISSIHCENDEQRRAVSTLIQVIENNKGLFRSAPFKKDKPTVLRGAVYRKDTLAIIREGIEYLLKQKASGKDPHTWRYI